MNRHFDVCVIGSGASGSVITKCLADKGWDVVIVEQGDLIEPGTNIDSVMSGAEKAYAREADGKWGQNGYPWSASAVGGGTIFYAGISFRYKDVDFNAREYVAPDAMDPRWPIQYSDLDPYYNKIEQWLGVSGDLNADPYKNKSGTGALRAAHSYSQQGALIHQAGKKRGLRPFPTPLAVNTADHQGYPGCDNLTSCTDYACPIGAKADSYTRILKPTLQRSNVTLLKHTKALAFHQKKPSEIDTLECMDLSTKERFYIQAKHFVLAGNAIQSAALVLRSTNQWWPDGVGNQSGLVGSGLSFKNSEYVSGWVEDHPYEKLNEPLKGLYSTVSITDHYLDKECPSGLGGLIYEANPWSFDGCEGKGIYIQLECIIADQPMMSNKVRLSNDKEATGVPKIIIDYQTHEWDRRRLSYMIERTKELLNTMGAENIRCNPSYYYLGSAHLHGTCRAGTDEQTSVVDKFGRFHTIDNLFAADGSFMPFAGGVNPTLTIQANALRIAEHMAL
ncbi:GMC family oxidoreductase [Paenibacillus sp. MZ04-78.2]|uniref:GMC oxidoreductase n=1 Tax=Paenibacillus sp. MZ04-78.2 TaxID=2962034 RepID=UPI0020B766C1|nr:GMC family oxidoreductase [Paenibacillus sp. MZ04-78.2]MCP3774492.1 GMC family oxidoreductase [Paenibacillus sp. MZ04-78.2]